MALTYLAHGSFQTPGYVRAEAKTIGSNVSLDGSLGGFTPNAGMRLLCPPEKSGTVHYETRVFTVDAIPSSFWHFGFHVRFQNVDFPAGSGSAFVFWSLRRAGLEDVSLNLTGIAGGHRLEMLYADGTLAAFADNPFTEATDHYIEFFGNHGFFRFHVDGVEVFSASGDFKGDTTGDQDAYFRFEGQIDPAPSSTNIRSWFGPWFASQDSAGSNDLAGSDANDPYIFRHTDATTAAGCDEFGVFPGVATNLDAGVWSDTSDDVFTTFARYTGAGAGTVGSGKEMIAGPAPHFRPSDVFHGCEWIFVTGGQVGGTYRLIYGMRRSEFNYFVSTVSVGVKRKYTSIWGAPGVLPAPTLPREADIAVMGGLVDAGIGKSLDLLDCYFVVYGPRSQGLADWPVKIVQREHSHRGIGRGLYRGIGR